MSAEHVQEDETTERCRLPEQMSVDYDAPGHHGVVRPVESRSCFLYFRSETQASLITALLTTVAFGLVLLGYKPISVLVPCTVGPNDTQPMSSDEGMRQRFRDATSASQLAAYSKAYSADPHLAGSPRNNALAQKTAELFRSFGLEVRTQTMPTLLANLSYRSIQRVDAMSGAVLEALNLDEPNIDQQAHWNDALPPSNAFSGSGRVVGPVVWANYGRAEDFAMLHDVNLTGCIVLVRYGQIFRGDKVRLAAQRGAAGVIITHDPADMAQGPAYPLGPWATNNTVQRGSVSMSEGDPLTPTWPAEFGGPTIPLASLEDPSVMGSGLTLPLIPVQPIGFGNAMRILQGIGLGAASFPLPATWQDTGFLDHLADGVGPGAAWVALEVRRKLQTFNITNVFGTLVGSEEPDRTVLLGAHRDAWTYGTADPISGHSTMLEVARVVGLMSQNATVPWRPRRSIQFCSWDAEEWSIIGSIEYVETNVELLRQRAVAYLNVDTAVSGTEVLSLSGSPLLLHATTTAAAEVILPDGATLASIIGSFTPPGSGTDHVGFIQQAGVPVLDSSISNRSGSYEAVYHSNYDNYDWMSRFGDPGFVMHQRMAQFQGSLLLLLADSVLLPLRVEDYASSIGVWVQAYAANEANAFANFGFIEQSVALLQAAAQRHALERDRVASRAAGDVALSAAAAALCIRRINDVAMGMERVFVGRGLVDSGQPWYLHVIFTPSAVNFYAATTMPQIADALATGDAQTANFAIGRVAQFIRRAATYVNDSSVAPPWYTADNGM